MESIIEITVEFTCKVQPGVYDEGKEKDLRNSIQTQLETHPELYNVNILDLCVDEVEEDDEDEDEEED